MSSGSFAISASVRPTTQQVILNAIVQKLRTTIPEFASETLCFVSDTPWPGIEIHDETFCTVCPSSSQFENGPTIGAGPLGVVENGMFQVSVWTKLFLDPLEHAEAVFNDSSRGLLVWKQKVLKSLAGQQLYDDCPTDTVPLLIEWLRPTHAIHPPSRPRDVDFSSFSLTFAGPFYWDLT